MNSAKKQALSAESEEQEKTSGEHDPGVWSHESFGSDNTVVISADQSEIPKETKEDSGYDNAGVIPADQGETLVEMGDDNMKIFSKLKSTSMQTKNLHELTCLTVSSIKPSSTSTVITIYTIFACSSVLAWITCTFVDI